MKSIQLKCAVVCFVLLLCSMSAWSDIHSKIEDKIGWGSCVACAGGASNHASIATNAFHASPSLDGASRDFYINGAAYSNALWWYKLGAHNSAKNFRFDLIQFNFTLRSREPNTDKADILNPTITKNNVD